MKEHPNFYETVDEVRIRLKDTVVMYDGHPYYVLNVANHKKDGIFRLYLDPLKLDDFAFSSTPSYLGPHGWPSGDNVSAIVYDEWLDSGSGKGCGILRKQMNSPLFSKFRPFPLGMCNSIGSSDVSYLIRSPTRSTCQGLTGNSIRSYLIHLNGSETHNGYKPHVTSPDMCRTILGQYPTAEECLEHLLSPRSANNSLAFHREFCLIKGPIDMMFLVYKTDVVGSLVENNLSRVMLGRNFKHLREVVQELGVFGDVV